MKIIKHEVRTYVNGRVLRKYLYSTKKQAMEKTRTDDGYSAKVYSGPVEIELYCANCDKDLNVGDDYIKSGADDRYCSDCYEEQSTTYYVVGGEVVGSDDDIEEYSSLFPEITEVSE